MSPIRVALVGLSPNANAGRAAMAHLPYVKQSPDYEVVAVMNSSMVSGEEAIKKFELPPTVKAFADAEALAKDPNIDMIAICVEVKHHYVVAKSALQHRKMVFCEWPLAATTAQANELANLAAEKNVRTMVDIESPLSPPYKKIRDLITSGEIGQVTSTDVLGSFGPPMDLWSERGTFYLDINSGQNVVHTRFGHFIHGFCNTLGEFEVMHSFLTSDGKPVKVYDLPMPKVFAEAKKDPESFPYRTVIPTSPTEILLQGELSSGAIASVHFRTGGNDSDQNNFRWLITGTQGSIEITQSQGQCMRDLAVKIKLVKNGNCETLVNDWGTDGEWSMYGDNVVFSVAGRNYKAFAENREDAFTDFQRGAKRAEMLERIIREGVQK